jgi:hypothetical protein
MRIMSSDTCGVPVYRKNFEGFLEFIRERGASGASMLSPNRFIKVLGMDLQTLAAQAHVHRNTISRAPASESVQHFLRQAIRVIRAATDMSGDIDRAIFWYRNDPIPTFGYKTAETLVTEGSTEDLLRYIQSLDAAVAG